jgi:hypothetical protein
VPSPGVPHQILDEDAIRPYRRRIEELSAQPETAERRAELDRLTAELTAATGMNGRGREFAGTSERARLAVSRAIHRAIARIDRADPGIGELLRQSIPHRRVLLLPAASRHRAGVPAGRRAQAGQRLTVRRYGVSGAPERPGVVIGVGHVRRQTVERHHTQCGHLGPLVVLAGQRTCDLVQQAGRHLPAQPGAPRPPRPA